MELEEFQKVLDRFAEDVNNAAKRTLGSRRIGKNRSYGVASRSLQKSLTYSITDGQVLFGSPNPSAPFIHWGVNGTRKKRGAPYSYKHETPGRKHVKAIVQWMKDKPVRLRDQKSGQFIAKVGPKGGDRVRSTAWVIARAIKRKGIAGLRYYVVALESIVPQYNEEFGEAVVSDILKSLTFDTGNIKIKTK